MTCSKRFGRLLQASCLGLIGMLTMVGCGGSSTTKHDAGPATSVTEAGVAPAVVTVDQAALLFGSIAVGSSSAPKTVTVTVTGALGSTAAVSPTVTGTGFALSTSDCGVTQAAGTKCTVSVVFSPTTVGAASGVLTIGTATVALSGTGTTAPVFSAAPLEVPLGTLLVGATGTATITITPTGTLPSLSCLASGADLTLTTQTCPVTGQPVSTACTYTFSFKAAAAGQKNETIVCNGSGTTVQIPVTANVVTPSLLAISPTTQDFIVNVGQSATFTFNVANNGGSQTGTVTPAVTGAGFTMSSDCPPVLAALGTCKIQVTFAPAAAGKVAGSLTVTDATPGSTPATATLNGTGLATAVTIAPATNNFGTVVVGQTKTAAFTMTNGGTAATGLVALAVADPQFTVGNDLCTGRPLAVSGSCTFNVTFAPAAAGPAQTTLVASQTADGAVLAAAALSGIGQAAPKPAHLTMSPQFLDFGTTGVQVPVGPKVFTITNDGDVASGALTVLKNVSTSESAASQFTFTSPDCAGATLAPAATCHVAVTFAPTIVGSASAVIIVTDGTASTASLTGGTTPDGTVTGIALGIPPLSVDCDLFSTEGTVVGDTEKVVCTVTNNEVVQGNTPQESGLITITPASNTPATGTFAVGTNNCTASLQPNTSCTFELVFSPLAKGVTKGSISITSTNKGANNQQIQALGLLVVEVVTIVNTKTVTDYDFGQVPVGGSSADAPLLTTMTLQVFVRKQVGNLAITGTDLFWSGDAAKADFFTDGGCPKITNAIALKADPKTQPWCTAMVTFTPQAKGAKTNTVKAAGGDGSSDTADMQGTGTGPLTIQPSPLTFDAVAAGASSKTPLTLTVCNHSSSPAQNAAFTITGPNAADIAIVSDPITNQTIPASAATCPKVILRLDVPAGTANGPISATAGVTATIAGTSESATGDLVGSVVTGATLTATLGGAFPSVAMTNINATNPVVVTVKNTGSLPTDVLNFDIPDQNGAGVFGDFLFDTTRSDVTIFGLAQGTCAPTAAGVSPKLNPGDSCTLNVWFKPNASLGAVQRNSILTISSAVGGLVVLDLTATATGELAITPAGPIDFGTWAFADPASTPLTITLTNSGGENIATSNLGAKFADAVGQTGAGSTAGSTTSPIFRQLGGTCTSMATLGKAGSVTPPNTCTYILQMYDIENAPAGRTTPAPGFRATTFEVTNNASSNGTQKATVVLQGTPVAAPDLEFTTASQVDVDFGAVALDSTSKTVKFTVTNKGGLKANAMSYDFYTISGSNVVWPKPSDIVKSGCTADAASLAPGASCDITVAFHPTRCPIGVSNCTNTSTLAAQLKVTYTLNGNTITLGNAPIIRGTAVDTIGTSTAAAVPDIVETTSGLAPYDFGWVTKATTTVTLAVHNRSTNAMTISALNSATITSVNGVNVFTLATPSSEFAVGAGAPTGSTACNLATTTPIAALGSCTFLATWTPVLTTTGATREVQIQLGAMSVVGSTPTAVTSAINLLGRVPTPASLVATSPFGISAQPLNFGNAVINTASPAMAVTIQNQGETATAGDLDIISGTGVGGISQVSATGCQGTGSQLASGASCVLMASVNPGQTGLVSPNPAAALRIVLDSDNTKDQLAADPATSVQALYVTFTGVNGAKITRTPTGNIDFDTPSAWLAAGFGAGTPVLSDGTPVTITLNNAANAAETGPMTFKTDSDSFTIDLDSTDSTCLAAGLAFHGLAASGSCNIVVVFSPTALATPAKTGNLIVDSANAAEVKIPLGGGATATATAVSSLAATAGATAVATSTHPASPVAAGTFTAATATAGTSFKFNATGVSNVTNYPTATFTIKKASGAPVTGLLSTGLSGTNAGDFRIVDDQCIGVSLSDATPGTTDQCQVTVRFAPTSVGTGKAATLTVMDPTSGTPAEAATVSLKGDANTNG